jgi:hypothetical protein
VILNQIKESGDVDKYIKPGSRDLTRWKRAVGVETLGQQRAESNKQNPPAPSQNTLVPKGESGNKILEEIRDSNPPTSLPPRMPPPSAPIRPSQVTDISSPSVKAGYSFKNDFEGQGDAKYAIEQSEKQLNKRRNSPNTAPSLDVMTDNQKKAFRDTLPRSISDTQNEIARLSRSLAEAPEDLKKTINKQIQAEQVRKRGYEEELNTPPPLPPEEDNKK